MEWPPLRPSDTAAGAAARGAAIQKTKNAMVATSSKARRTLPNWPTTASERARVALTHSPYENGKRLPKTFETMRTTFWRDGVADATATRKARAWIKSQRKIRNQATLCFDEIWSGLHSVATECKRTANTLEDARTRYISFASTMAFVIQPLLDDNRDALNEHDYGAPLSNAGVGCVEAAWEGKTPYA